MRKTLKVFGPAGQSVRVFAEGDLVRVQWRESGQLRTRSWPAGASGKAEALAFAKGFAEARAQGPARSTARVTTRELWEAYCEAEFPHMRPRTRQINRDDWRLWELVHGRFAIAEDLGVPAVARLRAALEKPGSNPTKRDPRGRYAVNTIRRVVHTVSRVYRWGLAADLLATNKVSLYRFKVAKEERPESPDEYTADERTAILAQLDPTKATQWRAHTALVLCFEQGVRASAALRLRWEDIDWTADLVTWRAKWDKLGKELAQPMRAATRRALLLRWADAGRPAEGWVIPAGSSKNGTGETYTIQSLWAALRGAERRAKVPHLAGRAMHGGRRGLVGDLYDAGHSIEAALEAVGDSDVRMAKHYVKRRSARVKKTLTSLDPAPAPVGPPTEPTDA